MAKMKPMKVRVPKDAVGYCGVVIPSNDSYQGIFIMDDPADHKITNLIMMQAMATGNATGALTATLVEGYMTGRQDIVRIAALAIRSLGKHDYFVVEGLKMVGGTQTNYQLLDATTIEEAREALENWPSVVELKLRIQSGFAGKKSS